MKKIIVAILVSLFTVSVIYATSISVSGTISSNTSWTGVDTVKVTGDITVNNAITLTIDPGIFVVFQGHYKLEVDGRLLAVGTQNNAITFTAANQSTGWNRIVFDNTSASNDSSKIVYCKLEYGKANAGGSSNYGGAIYIYFFDKILISNSVFSNNYAGSWGGAIYCASSDIEINLCDINNNTSNILGGGIFVDECNALIIGNLIRNNTATNSGGGIFFNSSEALSLNNTIVGNSPSGIICKNDADPIIRNTIIYNNSQYEVHIDGDDADPNFYHCDIEGGVVSFYMTGTSITFTGDYDNCIDIDPQFVSSGNHRYDITSTSPCLNKGDPATTTVDAGSYDRSGDARIQNVVVDIGAYETYTTGVEVSGAISENTTWNYSDTIKVVGDISVHNGKTLTISPGTVVSFQGHYKIDVGGCLLAVGTKADTITFTTLDHGTGWNRIIFDDTPASNDTSKIVYCKLEYGKGIGPSNFGGAIYIYMTNKVSISNSNFSNNEATWWGGGVNCYQSEITISRCIFKNNHASVGSALSFNDCSPHLINSLIINNQCCSGVLNLDNSNAIILNNTIVNNIHGGIRCINNSDPTIRNTIIYDNGGIEVYLSDNSSNPNFYYCDIKGGAAGFIKDNPSITFNGDYENCKDADPQFVNSGTHQYNLSIGSPCINAGDPATTTNDVGNIDISGGDRLMQGIIDIGAYEQFGISGIPGYAIEFDGNNDYISVPSDASLNNPQFTVEFWVCLDNPGNWDGIIDKGRETQTDWFFLTGSPGNTEGVIFGIGIGTSIREISYSWYDNLWHHIAGTYDGTTMKLYVDGRLKGSKTATMSSSSNKIVFGSRSDINWVLKGKLDEVTIWDYARGQQEIRENQHLTLKGTENGLVGYWQFNTGSGNIAYDPVNNNHGNLTNMNITSCWIKSTVPTGDGESDTQTEVDGIVDFIGTSLSMNYNTQNGASVTATRIDLAPNIDPAEPDSVFNTKYWIVNRFGSGTFDADLTFTLSEDLSSIYGSNPCYVKLYTRASNADWVWTYLATANSVDAVNNKATFNGINSFSQFIVGLDTIPFRIIIASDTLESGEDTSFFAQKIIEGPTQPGKYYIKNGASVTMTSDSVIHLHEGFNGVPGSRFDAIIDPNGCPANPPPPSTPKTN